MFVLLSPSPRNFLPPGIRSSSILRTQGGWPSPGRLGHFPPVCPCNTLFWTLLLLLPPFQKRLSDAETHEYGDLGTRSTRSGRRQGGAFLICSTVDPYSVDLGLSCSVTQIDSCFDLRTQGCIRHPQSRAPHTCSQTCSSGPGKRMSSLSHSLS